MEKVYICSEETIFCPICSSLKLKIIGSRVRKVIESNGSKKVLIIRRYRCRECKKIHHELPDILVPYKRHCAETIENIINKEENKVCCENSTIRKIRGWWQKISVYFYHIIDTLIAKYGLCFSKPIKPREIVRAVTNSNLWAHTRSAFPSG